MYFAALSETGDQIQFAIMVVLAVAIGTYLIHLNRKKAPEDTPSPYAVLKEEELRTIPDDKLASVVMANLLAKMDKKHPEPYVTIPPLGEARCTVYCVWLFDRILQEDGAASLRRGREVKLLDFAVEGFRTVGAPRCAEAVAAIFDGNTPPKQAERAYLAAAAEEKPAEALIPYIKDNLPLFCDGE